VAWRILRLSKVSVKIDRKKRRRTEPLFMFWEGLIFNGFCSSVRRRENFVDRLETENLGGKQFCKFH
jgi:hypothetical protein